MDKGDNAQAPSTTGESSAGMAVSPAAATASSPSASNTSTAGTPSSALGNPGFLQNVQQRLDSMGDDAASFLAGRYESS